MASGDLTFTMGYETATLPFATLAIGRFNSIEFLSCTTWNSSDPVFIIGNGTDNANRKNALTVLKNAKTGINSDLPQALLHMKAIESSANMHIRLENNSTSDFASLYFAGGDMTFRTHTSGNQFVWRNSSNTGNMYLQHGGDLFITGTYQTLSDMRAKKNVFPIQNCLQKILSIGGYHYNWIDASKDGTLQTGLPAQQVETQMPELVKTNEEGIKSVNYNGMIPYLIEAIKELKQENDLLKKQIQAIKK